MADSKKFIPFSTATSQFRSFGQGGNPKVNKDLLPEPEPDYKEAFETAAHEVSKLKQQLFDEKRNARTLKSDLKKEKSNFESLKKEMEEAIVRWRNEIRSHTGEALINALTQILQMPDLIDIGLSNRIQQAMSELSDKKSIQIHVSPKQKEFTEKQLSSYPNWEVIADPSIDSGALIKAEQGRWDTRMQIAINETIAIIQAWVQDQ